MAKKTLKINLFDSKSLQSAIKQIEQYQDDLPRKCELFIRRLSEVGISVVHATMQNVDLGHDEWNYSIESITESSGITAKEKIVLSGKRILYVEFGAGVHYNGAAGGSPHPKGEEMGYTIGSYGKGQGKNDFWFYYADTGEAVMSHGTQATMPMYRAGLEMRRQILAIAKEVFD